MHRPIVIVPACHREIGAARYHTVSMKYVEAVDLGANGMPLILPALGERTDWPAVLDSADGILLTGSPSNVHPSHFDQNIHNPALPLDAARDATTLPLIRAALQRGIPLLAICRGMQEVNVALGGSLHQAVHEQPGMMDHRHRAHAPLHEQYAATHRIRLTHGGRLAGILGGADECWVNSLHGQGIDRLAPGLSVEARADDGLIEAYSVSSTPGFALAVQWHPEWHLESNPDAMKLWTAFGAACRQHQAKKHP